MRKSPLNSLVSLSFAVFAVACGADPANDDLFGEGTDPTFAAGTGAAADARGEGIASAARDEQPSAGAAIGGSASASGESQAGSGSAAGETSGSASAGPSGNASPSGGTTGAGSTSGGGSAASAELHLCGKLEAFTAAGAQAGAVVIGGKALPIAAGTTVSGELLATVGANVCLDAKLDDAGNVRASASLSLDLAASLQTNARAKACGTVTAYVAASASAKGNVALGACGIDIAANASVTAEAELVVGASVCVDASLDRDGAIVTATVSAH